MIRPGPLNGLGDVAGLVVGNAEDKAARTGVTVVLADPQALAAADVRGGAPGTVNTDALRSGGLITRVNGVVLSGGSVFGLEAVAGLIDWLAERGRGFSEWGPCLPIVTGAILFDLLNGGDKAWRGRPPYRALAARAADSAAADTRLGNVGAGFGAVAGGYKGGLGTASAFDPATGATVGALVAVNSVGSVTMPGSRTMWAWHLEQANELGGQAAPRDATGHAFETKRGIGMNTTIGIVATDAKLDHGGVQRLAAMAQGGYASAIRPIYTPYDGDTLFALATGTVAMPDKPDALVRLGAVAADVVARAVMRGVYEARTLGDIQAYRAS